MVLRALCGFSIGIAGFYLWANSRLVSDTRHISLRGIGRVGLAAAIRAPDIALYVFIAAAVIPTATPSSASQMLFGNPVSHFLGTISYSLYLIHSLLITVFVKLVALLTTKIGYPAAYFSALLIYLVFSVARASVSYSLFEVRARKFLEKIALRPAPAIA